MAGRSRAGSSSYPDRDEDIGAMYLRHLLWRVREDCGDGTATTAVIFHEVMHQGVRYIVQGGSAMLLRQALEKGARLVLAEIEKMARPGFRRRYDRSTGRVDLL